MSNVEFIYDSYSQLIEKIQCHGYSISNYHNYHQFEKICILRHDIDMDIYKAYEFARFELQLGVRSTYFLLLGSNFYNVYTKSNLNLINEMLSMGHEIGLHFDETKYPLNSGYNEFVSYVEEELYVLGRMLGINIKSVSMHRPSKSTLSNNYEFSSAINSYSNEFFCDFKYISDSRMAWKEDVFSIIKNGDYEKLHILTHPIWYSRKLGTTREKLLDLINDARVERYTDISDNFRDLQEFIKKEELL